MRVVFFGTPEFAVPTLEKLCASSKFDVVGIITQPDAKRGRGNTTSPSPIKIIAQNLALPVFAPAKLKKDPETLAALANFEADVFVVVAYGQILSPAILAMPKHGCINVHGSLLPKYRGAAPIQWALANGETTVGITTMQMDAGIDTGDMLLKSSLAVLSSDNAESLSQKLALIGADLLIETLQNLNSITPIPQDHLQNTYAPTIGKELWQIDWQKPALILHNQIRGFYPNCFTTFKDQNFNDQRLKITATEVVSGANLQAGTVIDIQKNRGFVIQTADEGLLIQEVQPAGKRLQPSWDFVNGAKLKIGDILG